MAEKSVIMWPYNMLTSSNDALILHPEDTSDENAHLLITESVADDDATYIYTTNTANFMVGIPTKGNIIGVKVYFRAKGAGTDYASQVGLRASIKGDENRRIHSSLNTSSGNDIWENYTLDFSNESSLLEAINSTEYEDYITLWLGSGRYIDEDDGDKFPGEIASILYTQAYVEFIYKIEDSSSLYLYENGTWVNTPSVIYQKQNGTWTETDDSVFSDGNSFILQQI